MYRNILIYILLFTFFACTSKKEKDTIILTEQEKYEFINNIYRNQLNKGCVYLYDEPIITTFPKDSILVLDNITFRKDLDSISGNHELWKEGLLDKRFFLIKTCDNYDSDTLFKNTFMISISHPIIDISGNYILITEKTSDYGCTIDRNTYIYTKDNKNNWNVYYKLHIGKGFDE